GLSPSELRDQIMTLNTTLYSPQAGAWEPKALRSAFHAFLSKKQKTQKTPDSILEPLYKT
ncbi:MAG: hypothetical protein WBO73_02940, partial [Gammaproteobacteria bacterium]